MNFKKGDVIIRQGWGSQSPTNGLKIHKRLPSCSIGGSYHGSFTVDGMFFLFLLDYIQGHENGIQGHYARGADDYNQIASFTTFCLAKNVT